MKWARYFYWCFRCTVAAPIAVLVTLALLGLMVFEALFGVPKGRIALDVSDLLDAYRLLFTETLTR